MSPQSTDALEGLKVSVWRGLNEAAMTLNPLRALLQDLTFQVVLARLCPIAKRLNDWLWLDVCEKRYCAAGPDVFLPLFPIPIYCVHMELSTPWANALSHHLFQSDDHPTLWHSHSQPQALLKSFRMLCPDYKSLGFAHGSQHVDPYLRFHSNDCC